MSFDMHSQPSDIVTLIDTSILPFHSFFRFHCHFSYYVNALIHSLKGEASLKNFFRIKKRSKTKFNQKI